MRLLLPASVALGALLAGPAAQGVLQKKNASPPRRNELSLAQLRPGKDSLADAVMRYGPKHRPGVADSEDVVAWVDPQRKLVLRIELNEETRIDSITLASIDPLLKEAGGTVTSLPARGLTTGRGLALGDSRARVLLLYGPPGNTGPSTMEGRELEFMFYAFDWAGPDVPQVMEVTCERASGRVVKITLAFPSL